MYLGRVIRQGGYSSRIVVMGPLVGVSGDDALCDCVDLNI